LNDEGVVMFKWNSIKLQLDEMLPLCRNFVPMFGQNFNWRIFKTKDAVQTTWLCMRKDLDGRQAVI
jgi:hypothetical protein